MEDENLIKEYLEEFAVDADEWFKKATFLEERFDFFRIFFKEDHLRKLEWTNVQELGDNLHCFTTNALAKRRAFGEPNHPIEHYRESLMYLAHGSDSPRKRIDSLSDKNGKHRLKFISKSAISELIGYIMPEKYTFFNSRSRKALDLLGIKVETKRKETLGDKFENFSEAIKPLNELYEKIVGKRTKLPLSFEIDQFLSYLAENYDLEDEEEDDTEEENTRESAARDNKEISDAISLNQIYYGPPGTGKTYKVIEESLNIVLNEEERKQLDWNKRADIVAKFNEFRAKGYIEMVTFHQSYSYEEFVEGIRPDVSASRESDFVLRDGVFKEFVLNADPENDVIDEEQGIDLDKVNIFKISLGNTQRQEEDDVYDYCINNGRIAIGYGHDLDYTGDDNRDAIKKKLNEVNPEININDFNITSVHFIKNVMKKGDVVIVSDGNRKFRAIGVLKSDKYIFEKNEMFSQQREVSWIKVYQNSLPASKILTCNFSQMSIYELNRKRMKIDALKELVSKKKITENRNYVFIIDEINRGNLSKIFGELITLLEEDKRKGNMNGVAVKLPYSLTEFILPKNLYVIGTMNTADRSIAMMDMALRRRFNFIEVAPEDKHVPKEVGKVQIRDIFSLLNKKIAILLSRDFRIGHSYFMNGSISSLEALKKTWFSNILPLIGEYFYDEPKKIKALVGPFVKDEEKLLIDGFEYLAEEQSVKFKRIDDVNDADFIKNMNSLLSNFNND